MSSTIQQFEQQTQQEIKHKNESGAVQNNGVLKSSSSKTNNYIKHIDYCNIKIKDLVGYLNLSGHQLSKNTDIGYLLFLLLSIIASILAIHIVMNILVPGFILACIICCLIAMFKVMTYA